MVKREKRVKGFFAGKERGFTGENEGKISELNR